MADRQSFDLRSEIIDALMEKIDTDPYPSNTMLNMIEDLITPEELPRYAESLLRRIHSDNFPSIPMIARLKRLT
jgi:hypothetical protein